MNFPVKKAKSKILVAALIAFSFIIVAFSGIHLTMKTDEHGTMQTCSILGQFEKECTMGITEHIAKWRQFLTAVFQPTILSQLLMIAAGLAFSLFGLRYGLRYLYFAQGISSPLLASFKKPLPLFRANYLLAAFSKGILRKRE